MGVAVSAGSCRSRDSLSAQQRKHFNKMAGRHTPGGLPAHPSISVRTFLIAGLLVDVYGLEELEPNVPITCLWLLHPRTYNRGNMRDFAYHCVGTFIQHRLTVGLKRGLLALAFDLPNHGTRLVSGKRNKTWKEGNQDHALDMISIILAAKRDLATLIDLIGGYLGRGPIERHVTLGWSLGGHIVWEAWLEEQRIDAAVVVVGCPDFLGMSGSGRRPGMTRSKFWL